MISYLTGTGYLIGNDWHWLLQVKKAESTLVLPKLKFESKQLSYFLRSSGETFYILLLVFFSLKHRFYLMISYDIKSFHIFLKKLLKEFSGLVVRRWVYISNIGCSIPSRVTYCNLSRKKLINKIFIQNSQHTHTLIRNLLFLYKSKIHLK